MRIKSQSILLFSCFLIFIVVPSANSVASDKVGIFISGAQPGHYLQWNGKPVLLIGDSVTQGWMETGFNFDQKAYVDALASRGINLLMIWSYIGTNASYQRNDKRIAYNAPEIWPWVGSPDQKTFNLLRFNRKYFDRLKELVAYAENKNIVVLVTVHDGWTKSRFDGHPFNASLGNGPLTGKRQYVELHDYDNEMPLTFDPSWDRKQKNQYFQEQFCDKLISELNPYSNVIYEMFNEGEWYESNLRRKHEQHFLVFFKARTNNLLLTNTDHISGDDPHIDGKVDAVTLHGGWTGLFNDFQDGFIKTPVKPYLLSEQVPEWDGENITFRDIRRGIWEVALAGAGWVNQNNTSFGWDPNVAVALKASIREQAYNYAGYAARFFNNSGVKFWNMGPKAALCSTGICMAREGEEYVVYAPTGGTFSVDLSAASGKLVARWYNPRTGHFVSTISVNGKAKRSFQAPDGNDWVLHISKGR